MMNVKKTADDKLTVVKKNMHKQKWSIKNKKPKPKPTVFGRQADKPRCIKVQSMTLSTQFGYFMPMTRYNELQIPFSVMWTLRLTHRVYSRYLQPIA